MLKYDFTLLYVEDDIATVESMKLILEECFTKVYIANRGSEALELFQKTKIDIVLSDIKLPDFSGLELVEKLRKIDETVVVMLFSAYDERDYLFKAIELSVCDYLVKPFHLDRFERAVEKCIKRLQILKMQHLAYMDQLTGSYNRHKLLEMFESLRKQNRHFGLVMIDIDDFKQINDTFGHKEGDVVLQKLVECIKKNVRRSDFLARWGGEEFVLIIPDIDIVSLKQKMEQLQDKLRECDYALPSKVTLSMGVGVYEGESSFDDLLSRVDKVLYRAKRNGKNRMEMA